MVLLQVLCSFVLYVIACLLDEVIAVLVLSRNPGDGFVQFRPVLLSPLPLFKGRLHHLGAAEDLSFQEVTQVNEVSLVVPVLEQAVDLAVLERWLASEVNLSCVLVSPVRLERAEGVERWPCHLKPSFVQSKAMALKLNGQVGVHPDLANSDVEADWFLLARTLTEGHFLESLQKASCLVRPAPADLGEGLHVYADVIPGLSLWVFQRQVSFSRVRVKLGL